MKYFFVVDENEKRHILVAKNVDEAISIAANSVIATDCYELLPDTFQQPGFLISDK
jgi:hypothetical protein